MNTPWGNTPFSFISYKGWLRVNIPSKNLTNDCGLSKNDDQISSGSWFPIMIVFTEPCLSLAAAVWNVTCFSEPLPGDCATDRTSNSLTDFVGVLKYSTGETILLASRSPPDLSFNRFLSNNFLISAFPANAKRVKNMTLGMIKTWLRNPAFSVEGNHWKQNYQTKSERMHMYVYQEKRYVPYYGIQFIVHVNFLNWLLRLEWIVESRPDNSTPF